MYLMKQTAITVIITTASTAALVAPTAGTSGTAGLEDGTASGTAGTDTLKHSNRNTVDYTQTTFNIISTNVTKVFLTRIVYNFQYS